MIISYEQLKDNFGGSSSAEVRIRLDKACVKYFIGKSNHPFTTIQALNQAMGIKDENKYNFVKYKSTEIEIE